VFAGASGEARRGARALTAPLRAGDWWDHKLPPALAVLYGTFLSFRLPISPFAPAALGLLAAIAAAAAFASVINDLADRGDDERAGKVNRMAGRSRGQAALLVAMPVLVGLGFVFAWRASLSLVLAYAGSWLAFSLYSLPPFRLKARGFAGVVADASGAHLFPALAAIAVASFHARRTPDFWWAASVGIWAFAYGVRGMIWHQLLDRENDRKAGISTFARRLSPERTARLGARIVFPLELAGLAGLLARLAAAVPIAFLPVYFGLLLLRIRVLKSRPIIVAPRESGAMVLQEYYELFLPVSILCASALAHPLDWTMLLAHVTVFHRRWRAALAKVVTVARSGA
jgi:4-hydroxybenzoate polyprenyltransferase